MSAVTQPRGPLPARVYWTRRVLLLVLAFVLVFGLARILGDGSDGQSGDAGASQVGAEPTEAADGTDDEAGQENGSPAPRPERANKKKKNDKPEKKVLAQPEGPCAPADLVVVPVVDRAYADDAIRIRFEVRGTEAACTWEASARGMVVKLTSGKDLIWSSQQCPDVLPTKDLVVRDEKPARYAFTWNGRRSDDECSKLTKWAMPGWYHAVSAALGGEPTDRQFELRRMPRETVTKTAEPKPKKKKAGESRPTAEAPDGQRDGAQEPNG